MKTANAPRAMPWGVCFMSTMKGIRVKVESMRSGDPKARVYTQVLSFKRFWSVLLHQSEPQFHHQQIGKENSSSLTQLLLELNEAMLVQHIILYLAYK